jgi:hypothetical protein
MRYYLWPGGMLSPFQPRACGCKMWYVDLPMVSMRRLMAKRAGDFERKRVYHREESPSLCPCQQIQDMGWRAWNSNSTTFVIDS